MNKVIWTTKAAKNLLKIDSRYYAMLKEKTEELANFPDVALDLKKLKGTKSGYRLRVGNYRILFDVIDGVPVVIEIKAVMKRSERTYN